MAFTGDHDQVHILESCVVTWTKQIKNVLKLDPDELLKKGEHPGPDVELAFWTERAANLNAIHDQLEGDAVQKVVQVLQLARSTYHPAYLRLHSEVQKARTQANDNVAFLAHLRLRLEKMLNRFDRHLLAICCLLT
jgi:dynein heavy chain, axonemal